MKKNICIIAFILVTTTIVAQGYAEMPTYEFQSVNNTTIMSGSSGVGSSTYSSTIYDVGAESPTSGRRAGARKTTIGPPTQEGAGGNEPFIDPIGDAVLPLLLMAALAGVVTYVRRGRYVNRTPAGTC